MENINEPMIKKEEGKIIVVHDALRLSEDEYNDIKRQNPTITDKNLKDIAINIINTPNVFVNGQFVDPNNSFYNYVKLEIARKQKQERMYSEEPITTQNDMSNNEAPKEEEIEKKEEVKETINNPKIERAIEKRIKYKGIYEFNEKKDFLKEVLLKFAQLCDEFTVPNEDGVFDCSNECPFYSENIGCLLKDNNPLSQEKVATILMIHYNRTKDSGESVVYDYVNNKIKDLTEQEKEMLRKSIK